ncbi:hypothetical protein BG004_004538 [Podila humilis]|nr:hypothetical protein BG004_004538 [Podila humilis]
MSGLSPNVKDLYKVITADFTAYLTESTTPFVAQQQTIQQYLDRFVKSNQQSTHPTSSGPSISSSGANTTPNPAAGATNPNISTGSHAQFHSAQQRHANELWFQSLNNSSSLQHANNLPFAFHRLSQPSSTAASPNMSQPVSHNASTSASPILTTANSNNSGLNSPAAYSSPGFSITGTATASPLAAQRFSAHLITLFTQHGLGTVPIASVATRILVYLTHLLPFLTPQLVIADWWDRLLEPSLQGEIKLEKEALKTCRDLVTECMIRDSLWDGTSGTVLVAGDEEGQLEMSLAMTTMPIPQFLLRKYIVAAHRLNHRLQEDDRPEDLHPEGSVAWLRAKMLGRAGHGSGLGLDNDLGVQNGNWNQSLGNTGATPGLSFPQQRRENTSVMQEVENQQKLFSKARAVVRRKKDLLVKNLEAILFAYGGNVNRVKDFFSCLYTYFVGAHYRAEILGLLCQFIRRQRVHLHQVLATPLFDSLLLSLKYDTSPLIVSLGLMTLIMLMPRIPAALNEKLPDLFLILARIICWPRSRQQLLAVANQDGNNLTGQTIKSFDEFGDEGAKRQSASNVDSKSTNDEQVNWSLNDFESEDIPLYHYGIRWRRHGPALPGGTSEGAPDPTAIFSFLYGLFPNNLLKFLHSPRLYLSQTISPTSSPRQGSTTDSSGDGEAMTSPDPGVMSPKELSTTDMYVDEDLLKSRAQSLLKRHSLHPDLLNLTSEQEMMNKARWQKLEPMEIVAMCVGLDVWSAGGPNGTGPVLRSIEEDSRSATHVSSDLEDEATEDHPQEDVLTPSLPKTVHPHDAPEVHSSDDSDNTPIELLSQEEFFGPRAWQDQPSRAQSTTFIPISSRLPNDKHTSSHHLTGVYSPPRSRTHSREVRMSQILRNFTTLRGLDHDDYLSEAANKSFGTSILIKDRRTSKSSRTSEGSATFNDIPTDSQHLALVASQLNTDDDHRDPMVTSLLLLSQEYRKTIVHLERDLLMAKNELNFELFLKQQHIQQISKVHRAHVLDASVEAERQNLYNTCRSLKAQLQETKLLLEKEKFELNQRKNKQTHWDTELKNKLQTFREERKALNSEVERLKQDIQDTRQAQEIQERLLTEERKGTFELTNTIEDLSPKLKRMEEYEKRILEMTRQLVLWEGEQTKSMELQRQMEAIVGRWQNLELLLAAEKEEARVLRNRVSQQSQLIDDLRIQMTIRDGVERDVLPKIPSIEFHNGQASGDGSSSSGGSDAQEERDGDKLTEEGSTAGHHGTLNQNVQAQYNNWPLGMSRSSSQSGSDQRRASAMREFMSKEKERWDQELQLAHNRLSREASKNRELEDRILELQGQLEIARAIDARTHPGIGGSGGAGGGTNSGGREGGGGGSGVGGGVVDHMGQDMHQFHGQGPIPMQTQQPLHHPPSKPQNVPLATRRPMGRMHDDGDTDDGGIGSSGMMGRYSRQHETEDEDDIVGVRLRNAKLLPDLDAGSHYAKKAPSTASSSSSASKSKVKTSKTGKSKAKWLQAPSILERAQTDRSTYGLGSNPNLTAASTSSSTTTTTTTTTTGSSSVAARATSAGLFPPIYSRNLSHRSDGGSSDVTTASDSSATGSGSRLGGKRSSNNLKQVGEELESADAETEASASSSGGKKDSKNKSKSERERERERDKARLMSGMGPLVDPSKMYRNVRMF